MRKCIILLLVAFLAVCSGVAEEATSQPPRYTPGEDAALRLRLTAPAAAGLQMRLAWDPAVLEIANDEPELAAFFSQAAILSMIYAQPEDGVLTIVWLRATDVALSDVAVLDFSLRVREDAAGGESTVSIEECLVTDISGMQLHTQAEGIVLQIDAPVQEEGNATPAPTAELEPLPQEISTPEPYEAFLSITTQDEAPLATATPGLYIPSQPSGAANMVVMPTPTPVAMSVPTPATVVIGATPTPGAQQGKLQLRANATDNGFRLEIVANDVDISGLQAELTFDTAMVQCSHAAFTDAFVRQAMINMVHRNEGSIRMVYSNLEGFAAENSVIFTADFTAEKGSKVILQLTDVKGVDAELNVWYEPMQQVVVTVHEAPNNVSEFVNKGADAA